MIEIPLDASAVGHEPWPLDSERVRAEICLFAFRMTERFVLREREVAQIVLVLKGLAWRTIPPTSNLSDAFDQEPLLEAIHAHLTDENEVFEGTVSAFQSKL